MYTEDDLRKAFRAGVELGSHNSYFDKPLDENEYIESLKNAEPKEEETIPLTYAFLINKLGWSDFCILTGTNVYAKNEGFEFRDDEIFYIPKSKAEEYNLI